MKNWFMIRSRKPSISLSPPSPPLCQKTIPEYPKDIQVQITRITTLSLLHPDITAESNPQWDWTQSQCHAWLLAVFTKTLSLPLQEAEIAVQKFSGFGGNIFLYKKGFWADILGDAKLGAWLHKLVDSLRRKEGAYPSGYFS